MVPAGCAEAAEGRAHRPLSRRADRGNCGLTSPRPGSHNYAVLDNSKTTSLAPTERAVQRQIRALLPVVLSGRRRMSVESWVPADVLNRGANSCPGCVDLAHCNRNVTRLARPRFRTTRTLSPSAIHPCHRVRSTLVLVAVTRQSRRARPPLVTGVLVHLYRPVATCGHAHSNPR